MVLLRPTAPETGSAGLDPANQVQAPTFIGGSVTFRYRANGTISVSQRPRRRPRQRLNPLTQQQRRTWDQVTLLIKYLAPQEWDNIRRDIYGSTYAIRDLAIMDAYGNYVSWSGYGLYRDGLNRLKRPQILGFPQAVNVLTEVQNDRDGHNWTFDCRTYYSATPKLARFCCQPSGVYINKRRKGKITLQKRAKFFPCEPRLFDPTTSTGTHHRWELLATDADCPDCHFVIVEIGPDNFLNWNSSVYNCPKPPIAPAVLFPADTYLENTGAPSMPSSFSTLLFAFWAQVDPGKFWAFTNDFGPVLAIVYQPANPPVQPAPLLTIDVALNSAGDVLHLEYPGFDYFGLPGWHSIAFSADAITQQAILQFDNSTIAPNLETWGALSPFYQQPGDNYFLGGVDSSPPVYKWHMSNLVLIAGGPFVDLADLTARRLVFGDGPVAVDWGADASVINGLPAVFYLKGDAGSYNANLGTSGPFIRFGSPLVDDPDGPPT